MADQAPSETTNLDQYGNAPLPWSRAHDILAAPPQPANPANDYRSYLGTTGPDGWPHSVGVGALWYDGDLYVVSGPGTRKSRNLAANPNATITMGLPGLDLVLEGKATRVTDRQTLEAVAARYRENGWPAEVEGDAFTAPYSAPSAGPPPWHLYRFTYHAAFGVAMTEPWGATRWRFDN